MTLRFPRLHPERMGDNGPGFQPWDLRPNAPSPEGTADPLGLNRPYGTRSRRHASLVSPGAWPQLSGKLLGAGRRVSQWLSSLCIGVHPWLTSTNNFGACSLAGVAGHTRRFNQKQ